MSVANPTQTPYVNNVYGVASPGPVRYAPDSFKNYTWGNDITVNPPTQGGFARFIRIGAFLNPNGTATASGTANIMVRAYIAPTFDDTGSGPAVVARLGQVSTTTGLAGIQAIFNSQTSGSKYFTIDLSSVNSGLPMPYTTGMLVVEIGTVGAGSTFAPLQAPFSVQPIVSPMLAPGEPNWSGNNPSRSGPFQWDDDSTAFFVGNVPDYTFQDFNNTLPSNVFAELYPYDVESALGIRQAAATMFVDSNARTISGTVTLQGLSGNGGRPSFITAEIRNASNGASLGVQTVPLGAAGQYRLLDPSQGTGGSYTVLIKTSHWLRASVTATTTGGNATGRNVSLINGDVDGDNEVSILDYILLSANFGREKATEVLWDYPDQDGIRISDSDLDGDDNVSILDYLILSGNYGIPGVN
jgi:hypothetical protein